MATRRRTKLTPLALEALSMRGLEGPLTLSPEMRLGMNVATMGGPGQPVADFSPAGRTTAFNVQGIPDDVARVNTPAAAARMAGVRPQAGFLAPDPRMDRLSPAAALAAQAVNPIPTGPMTQFLPEVGVTAAFGVPGDAVTPEVAMPEAAVAEGGRPSFMDIFNSPATRMGLAALAQAFAQGDESQPGFILGQFGARMAEADAQGRFLQRLMAGEDPKDIEGLDVAGLSTEGRAAAIAQAEALEEGDRSDKRLGMEEQRTAADISRTEADIEALEASTRLETRRVVSEETRVAQGQQGIDIERDALDLQAELGRRGAEIQEFSNETQRLATLADNELRRAQAAHAYAEAEHARAAAAGQRAQTTSAVDLTLPLSRAVNSQRTVLSQVRENREQIAAWRALLNRENNPVDQRTRDAINAQIQNANRSTNQLLQTSENLTSLIREINTPRATAAAPPPPNPAPVRPGAAPATPRATPATRGTTPTGARAAADGTPIPHNMPRLQNAEQYRRLAPGLEFFWEPTQTIRRKPR